MVERCTPTIDQIGTDMITKKWLAAGLAGAAFVVAAVVTSVEPAGYGPALAATLAVALVSLTSRATESASGASATFS